MVGGVAHAEEHLALATKFRDVGCVLEIMPAVVTLERDFLWDGVLSQAAWALLEGKHVQSTGNNWSCRAAFLVQWLLPCSCVSVFEFSTKDGSV